MEATTTTKKQNLLEKLWSGNLPDMNLDTKVAISQNTLFEIAAILFITAAVIFLAWFAFKKAFN